MNNDTLPRGLIFLSGAATGLALGYYLHTEKGKELREQLSENWEELLQNMGERTQEQLGELMNLLSEAVEKGLLFADDMEETIQERVQSAGDDAIDTIEEVEESFENGMDRARARLNKKFNAAGVARDD